jgi:hypothetical protein
VQGVGRKKQWLPVSLRATVTGNLRHSQDDVRRFDDALLHALVIQMGRSVLPALPSLLDVEARWQENRVRLVPQVICHAECHSRILLEQSLPYGVQGLTTCVGRSKFGDVARCLRRRLGHPGATSVLGFRIDLRPAHHTLRHRGLPLRFHLEAP